MQESHIYLLQKKARVCIPTRSQFIYSIEIRAYILIYRNTVVYTILYYTILYCNILQNKSIIMQYITIEEFKIIHYTFISIYI